MVANTLDRYRIARASVWQWQRELSWVKKLSLAFGMACFIGLLAQARIPLPWTPVPITGQTFGVLLAAVLLGSRWGGVSTVIYVGLGIAGVPWFNGWTAGLARITGPTGGYLIGFIPAALFLGYFVDKFVKARSYLSLLGLMLFADFGLVFGPGLIQLYLWSHLAAHNAIGIFQLLTLGLLPFIAGEIVKVVAAASAARALFPVQRSR